MLQVLEDGRLTDSAGRTVSFRQCLIILTSNVGSHLLARGGNGLGFDLEADAAAAAGARARTLVLGELKAHFRPEFLNRLDEIVVRPAVPPARAQPAVPRARLPGTWTAASLAAALCPNARRQSPHHRRCADAPAGAWAGGSAVRQRRAVPHRR